MPVRERELEEQCEEKQHLRLWKSTAALILGARFISHAYLLLIGHKDGGIV